MTLTVVSSQDSPQFFPTSLQDFFFIDKIAHFLRTVIPERIVHAKGSGAHGVFKVTNDMSKYTKAKIFHDYQQTDLFVRFSTVGGDRGSADSERDPRGFAVKFYTPEGNYDIVGNSTPVFFINDPFFFNELVLATGKNPKTNLGDAN